MHRRSRNLGLHTVGKILYDLKDGVSKNVVIAFTSILLSPHSTIDQIGPKTVMISMSTFQVTDTHE